MKQILINRFKSLQGEEHRLEAAIPTENWFKQKATMNYFSRVVFFTARSGSCVFFSELNCRSLNWKWKTIIECALFSFFSTDISLGLAQRILLLTREYDLKFGCLQQERKLENEGDICLLRWNWQEIRK